MIRYILKRVLSTVPLVLGIATLIFVIVRLLPGDPTTLFLSPSVPPAVADRLRSEFGLDKPIVIQYGHWLWGVVRGELGFSFTHQQDVIQVIEHALPNTALLAVTAITLQLLLGILLAALAVRFYGSAFDQIISYSGLIIYGLPTFWIATLLLYLFSYWLGLLPSSQMHSTSTENLSQLEYCADLLKHLILPACTLALPGAAGVARYLRTQLLSVLKEDYITAARSMGLSEGRIFFSYALPNALLPVITITGLEFGTLLTGAIVTETIFAWPGMGRITVSAILARDYPLVVGCALISGVLVIITNLLTDVLYKIADPRVRVEK